MEAAINDAKSAKVFQQKADVLLDRDAPGLFNQAVMELGAMGVSSAIADVSGVSCECVL